MRLAGWLVVGSVVAVVTSVAIVAAIMGVIYATAHLARLLA
jgi:hypothetical protein